jgi:hypothetical protein
MSKRLAACADCQGAFLQCLRRAEERGPSLKPFERRSGTDRGKGLAIQSLRPGEVARLRLHHLPV